MAFCVENDFDKLASWRIVSRNKAYWRDVMARLRGEKAGKGHGSAPSIVLRAAIV
jgi:hypothetical protein